MREDPESARRRSLEQALGHSASQMESLRSALYFRDTASQSLIEQMARDSRAQLEKIQLLSGFSFTKQLEESIRAFDSQSHWDSHVAGSFAADMKSLMADLKPLSTFGSEHWSRLSQNILADSVHQSAIFEQLSQSLRFSHPGLDRGVAEQIASAISSPVIEESSPAVERAASIEEVVARAVTSALAEERRRVDWRFVVSLILTILVFLYDYAEAEHSAAQSASEFARIEAHVLEVSARLDLLLTRPVLRKTSLRPRPRKNSPAIGTVVPGSTVVVQEYHGKWVKVRVLRSPNTGESASLYSGWMLKKYLGAAL